MNTTVMNEEIYKEINNLKVPSAIAKRLKEYSEDFRSEYKRYVNKMRNKKYREDNKGKINERRQEERGRIRISEIRPIEHKREILDITKIDKTAKRGYKKDGALGVGELKDSTKINYKAVIRTLYRKYKNAEIGDENEIFKMLEGKRYKATEIYKDFKFIEIRIEEIARDNGGYLSNIYSIFSMFKQKRLIGIRDKIYPYFRAQGEQYRENRHKNKINEEEIKKISFKEEDIEESLKGIEGAYNRLLYALMLKLPTRRLADYRRMRISIENPEGKDKGYNYYYDGRLYINNTKNKREMVQDISGEGMIKRLIGELPEGTRYLISGEEMYGQAKLSKIFGGITKVIYGTRFNARDIRKINATESYKRIGEEGGIRRFKEEAKNRGHRVEEALEYVLEMGETAPNAVLKGGGMGETAPNAVLKVGETAPNAVLKGVGVGS
jgi:hypothetical protein